MSERFRQFQALFPEEACLAALMRLRHGGTSMSCPACGRPAQFEPRPKLRGFACQHLSLIHISSAGSGAALLQMNEAPGRCFGWNAVDGAGRGRP